MVDHIHGIGELLRVPSEISLAVGVLDVQPNDVDGNVELVEVGVDRENVVLIVVVPSTLVISDGEGRRKWSRS